MVRSDSSWTTLLVASAAIAAAIALGLHLRLQDPLSSPVIPAEDPYTHMALVREHLADGTLDPLNVPGTLYPPGLHAYIATIYVYTGIDLYEIVRLGPVLFGGIGILGMALLLWRSEGPIAAFVGAVAVAVGPEIIFRTTMMSPTALDLAVLPFFLYALIEVVKGRLGWIGVAGPIALFFVFAHPWLLTIIALAGVFFAIAALWLRWPITKGRPMTAAGLAAGVGIVGLSWSLSLSGCWGYCGKGFRDIIADGSQLSLFSPIIAAVAILVTALLWFSSARVQAAIDRSARLRSPVLWRIVASCLLAIIVIAVTVHAHKQVPGFADRTMPDFVDLPRMLGWPALILGGLGLILLPFLRSPTAHIGAAIAATTYPFVVYNPLDSPYWPHRTAVYFGIGIAILAGVAANGIAKAAVYALRDRKPALSPQRSWRARPVYAVMAALLVAASLGGTVYAATPERYTGWYRLYQPCEMETLQTVADFASDDEESVVVTGSWQSKLVITALGGNSSRTWFKVDVYTKPEKQASIVKTFSDVDNPLYIVVDSWLLRAEPDADLSFLEHEPWQPLPNSCPEHPDKPTVIAYGLQAVQQ